jgi:hypothetical protein
MAKRKKIPAETKTVMFRPWMTTKIGRRLYQWTYALNACRLKARK